MSVTVGVSNVDESSSAVVSVDNLKIIKKATHEQGADSGGGIFEFTNKKNNKNKGIFHGYVQKKKGNCICLNLPLPIFIAPEVSNLLFLV